MPHNNIVLSLGLGIESTAVLLRWIEEPDSRDFPLDELIVVTAVVGSEYQRTIDLCTRHVLPRLALHRIRYVQITRPALPTTTPAYLVLDDSRTPQRLHTAGPVRLIDELAVTGTIPQSSGHRRCSLKWKGTVIDGWAADHLPRGFRHALGYSASEVARMARDRTYTTHGRRPEYPLAQWNWDRETAASYLEDLLGETFARSCCSFCPFQAGKEVHLWAQRWEADPHAGAQALLLETAAAALNPRQLLFGTRSAWDLARHWDLQEAIHLASQQLTAAAWSVYEVRRVYHRPASALRSVHILATGTRHTMIRIVTGDSPPADPAVTPRTWLLRRRPAYPALEHFLVAAPAGVAAKRGRGFDRQWHEVCAAIATDSPVAGHARP